MKIRVYDNDGRALTIPNIRHMVIESDEGDPFCLYTNSGDGLIWKIDKFDDEGEFLKVMTGVDTSIRKVPEKTLEELGA